jgi:hypothetical protein
MERTLERKGGAAPVVEGGWPRPEQPIIAWWAKQAVQASRLVAVASLLPLQATLLPFRLACAAVSPRGARAVAPGGGSGEAIGTLFGRPRGRRAFAAQAPSSIPGLTRGDLEELRSALQALEEARGDWSKAR